MSTMVQELFEQLDELRTRNRRVAMATLVETRGTSPKKEGSKMWVGEVGRVVGSVTIGGCVDAHVVDAAADVLRRWRPTLLSVDLGEEDALELGLTCAGSVDVLVEPVDLLVSDRGRVRQYDRVRAHVQSGRHAVVVTALPEGTETLLVLDEGSIFGSLGDAALDEAAVREARGLMQRGRSRTLILDRVGAESRRAFFEVHGPPPTLIVFGAGHVARPLVHFAKGLGMRVVVVDARERYASRESFPGADEIRVGIPSEIAEMLGYGPASAVVLVAHDYKFDLPVLKHVLTTDAGYIGLLGSRRRGRTILEFLAADGIAADELERVHVPVGLDIGAETAPEFAISILAEVLAVRAGRRGGPMRERSAR